MTNIDRPRMTLQGYMDFLAANHAPFRPHAVFDARSKFLEAYLKDDMAIAEPVGGGVVLLRSRETNEVVGVKVHGISSLTCL